MKLEITPIPPITEDQPALLVLYTCARCRADCRATLASPGFLPRYCLTCAAIVKRAKASAAQAAWRAEHSEDAKRLGRDRMRATRAAAKIARVTAANTSPQVETPIALPVELLSWTPDRFSARLSITAIFESCAAEYERRYGAQWGWQTLQYRHGAYYTTALGNAQYLGKRAAATEAMCRYVNTGRDNAAARRDGAR